MASKTHRDIVVIGASAGGIAALQRVLASLPPDLPAAVFVVLHIAPDSPWLLPALLSRVGPLPVVTAKHGDSVRHGQVVLAPPDHHLVLEGDQVRLSHGPRENRHRPSVDVLFRSAAVAHGSRVIGIVLTGLLDDGSAGLWAVKRRGGFAIAQDPADAEYPDMPRNAMQATKVDAVLRLRDIGPRVAELTRQSLPAIAEGPPEAMKSEVQMTSDPHAAMAEMDTLGKRTPLTCPECGGAMWEIDDTGTPRFRCHVGHAYSMMTLASEQSARVEAAIWAALRALEENARIADRMARAAISRGEDKSADFHEDRSMASARHAQVLRDILERSAEINAPMQAA